MSVSLRRGAVGLALASALVAGLAPAVHADNLGLSDGVKSITSVSLGSLCRGATASKPVPFALQRRGAVNNNVWASQAEVSIAGATTASGFTLGSLKATTPDSWTASDNYDLAVGSAGVALTVPATAPLGDATAKVTWTATGQGAQVDMLSKTADLTVTWNVTSCAPADTTPPHVSYVLDPATPSGTNGWYREPVTVDWTVSDAQSTAISAGCDDGTFSSDGTHISTCSATSAGGTTGPASATVKVDRTAPTVVPTVMGDLGDDDWYTGDVDVTWTVDDGTSGIAETSPDCAGTTLTTDTASASYTCTVTDKAGNRTSVTQEVKRDATAPAIGSSVSGTLGTGGWYVGDVTVDWTVKDVTSDLAEVAGCEDLVLTTDTAGVTYSCKAADAAGNTAEDSVEVKRDATAPTLTYSLSGTEGADNWFRGPVTVTWTATDGGSGLAQGCVAETISADGVHAPACTAYDVAGNATSSEALVQIDATKPVITPTVVGAKTLPGSDWYTSDVSITWEVTDATSTVATKTGCDKVDVVDDTAGTTYTCAATDVAGNEDSQSVTVKRDATAPVLTLTGGPAHGATYDFGDVPAPSTCAASDATSGLAGACTVTAGGTAVGTERTQVATATDQAGNVATETRTYAVAAWRLDGFYKPVTMGATVVNTVKAGSTVPLKFNVHKGGVAMAAGIGATFATTKVGCETGDVEDVVDFVTTGATALRYDSVAGQWVQNWATPGTAKGACYRVTMKTADGSSIVADFKLK
jgi:hypothetical protein